MLRVFELTVDKYINTVVFAALLSNTAWLGMTHRSLVMTLRRVGQAVSRTHFARAS